MGETEPIAENSLPILHDVFVIDPPWPKRKGGLRTVRPNQGRDLDYKTLSVADIFSLLKARVLTSAESQHCLFVWTIDQFLTDCDSGFADLGYKRHARLVWDKENGVAPAFTIRYSHEYLVWYYKGNLIRIAESMRGKYATVFREKSRQHSRKPDCAYKMIEAIYPAARKIDVFSREKRVGWDQFGDQVDYFSKQ